MTWKLLLQESHWRDRLWLHVALELPHAFLHWWDSILIFFLWIWTIKQKWHFVYFYKKWFCNCRDSIDLGRQMFLFMMDLGQNGEHKKILLLQLQLQLQHLDLNKQQFYGHMWTSTNMEIVHHKHMDFVFQLFDLVGGFFSILCN